MENSKKVSVIIPIYNVEEFLEQCIDSVLCQTYQNLEIILVDDGSKDTSGSICDTFAEIDSRIQVLHQPNAGVSAARNSGIDIATGDYVCFVDGDDYVMPDYVEYLLGLIQDNSVDIALSTELFTNYEPVQSKNDQIKVYTGEQATEAILCYNIPIGVYNKIFSSSFLGTTVRFLPELCIGEGFNFNTTAFQMADNVAIGHRKIYFYRKDNENSVTTKFNAEKWQNGLYAVQLIKRNFIVPSDKLEKAWQFAWWRTNTDVYDLLILANATQQYPEMYRECKKVIRNLAFACFVVPTSYMQRIRAMVLLVCPRLIPKAMVWRRKKHGVNPNSK